MRAPKMVHRPGTQIVIAQMAAIVALVKLMLGHA